MFDSYGKLGGINVKFMTINEDGFVTGFYSPEDHGENIPEYAIEITDEQALDMYENQAFRKWVNGQIVEYVPPPSAPYVPQSVTPAQGLMALFVLKAITEDDILAAISTIEDATLHYQAQIAYKKATVWDRVSETMGVVAQLLALTETDKDELFTLGATYTNL